MKKRILAIDQGEHLGGAERFFSELLTRVETHEVHLVTSGNPEYKKFYKDSAVIIHELPLPKLKPVRIGTLLEFRKARQTLGKLIETIQPTTITREEEKNSIDMDGARFNLSSSADEMVYEISSNSHFLFEVCRKFL
jgi:hypothetical protein